MPSQHPSKPPRNESQGHSDKTDREKKDGGGEIGSLGGGNLRENMNS